MRILRANKPTKIYCSPFFTGIEAGIVSVGEGDCIEVTELGRITNNLIQAKIEGTGWRWVSERDWTSFGKNDPIPPKRSVQTAEATPLCPLEVVNQ